MSRRLRMFAGVNDGHEDDDTGMPSAYWDVLRESRHEVIEDSYWHSLGR